MACSHSGVGGATMTQNTETLVQQRNVSRIMYVKYVIVEYTVNISRCYSTALSQHTGRGDETPFGVDLLHRNEYSASLFKDPRPLEIELSVVM
jgi:hypothetical protein